MAVHVGLQNCSYNQFNNVITSGIHVSKCKTHQCYSSEKITMEKKMQPLGERLQQKMFSPFVYIFCILLVEIR